MEFQIPSSEGFTVYSKSGCLNCNKVKYLLKEQNLNFNIVDCDDYIIDDKENFLLFIKNLSKKDSKQFPIIFHKGIFIGGYIELNAYISKLLLSFEEI